MGGEIPLDEEIKKQILQEEEEMEIEEDKTGDLSKIDDLEESKFETESLFKDETPMGDLVSNELLQEKNDLIEVL